MSKNGARPSYKAIITPIGSKYKGRKYLYRRQWKIPNPFNPRYFTVITVSVPIPDKTGDKPCVFLRFHNAHSSITLQFETLAQLRAHLVNLILAIDEDEDTIEKAHSEAWWVAYQREALEDLIAEELSKRVGIPSKRKKDNKR